MERSVPTSDMGYLRRCLLFCFSYSASSRASRLAQRPWHLRQRARSTRQRSGSGFYVHPSNLSDAAIAQGARTAFRRLGERQTLQQGVDFVSEPAALAASDALREGARRSGRLVPFASRLGLLLVLPSLSTGLQDAGAGAGAGLKASFENRLMASVPSGDVQESARHGESSNAVGEEATQCRVALRPLRVRTGLESLRSSEFTSAFISGPGDARTVPLRGVVRKMTLTLAGARPGDVLTSLDPPPGEYVGGRLWGLRVTASSERRCWATRFAGGLLILRPARKPAEACLLEVANSLGGLLAPELDALLLAYERSSTACQEVLDHRRLRLRLRLSHAHASALAWALSSLRTRQSAFASSPHTSPAPTFATVLREARSSWSSGAASAIRGAPKSIWRSCPRTSSCHTAPKPSLEAGARATRGAPLDRPRPRARTPQGSSSRVDGHTQPQTKSVGQVETARRWAELWGERVLLRPALFGRDRCFEL
eukprot:scaffold7381_cov310-Pinguiococcus_pyrenoidosus.AAC.33